MSAEQELNEAMEAVPQGSVSSDGAAGSDAPAKGSTSVMPVLEDAVTPAQQLAILTEMSAELSALNLTIEGRLRYDKVKEEAFERLYAELDEIKRNAAFEQVRPLYTDLILLFDRIEGARKDLAHIDAATPGALPLLETLSDELLEVLGRREVEVIERSPQAFDSSTQRAIGTQPAPDEAGHNRVVQVLRRGFRYRDRILRPEEVIVTKYTSDGGAA